MSSVQLSEGSCRWFTPLACMYVCMYDYIACGPGYPELSKSDLNRA